MLTVVNQIHMVKIRVASYAVDNAVNHDFIAFCICNRLPCHTNAGRCLALLRRCRCRSCKVLVQVILSELAVICKSVDHQCLRLFACICLSKFHVQLRSNFDIFHHFLKLLLLALIRDVCLDRRRSVIEVYNFIFTRNCFLKSCQTIYFHDRFQFLVAILCNNAFRLFGYIYNELCVLILIISIIRAFRFFGCQSRCTVFHNRCQLRRNMAAIRNMIDRSIFLVFCRLVCHRASVILDHGVLCRTSRPEFYDPV